MTWMTKFETSAGSRRSCVESTAQSSWACFELTNRNDAPEIPPFFFSYGRGLAAGYVEQFPTQSQPGVPRSLRDWWLMTPHRRFSCGRRWFHGAAVSFILRTTQAWTFKRQLGPVGRKSWASIFEPPFFFCRSSAFPVPIGLFSVSADSPLAV